MSNEDNKEIAIRLVRDVGGGQLDPAMLTEDAMWWTQGRGEISIPRFMKGLAMFFGSQPAGDVRVEIHGVTADGDRVAVESETFVPLKSGVLYNSTYHFLIRFRDGKACYVKEYFDTASARDAFNLPARTPPRHDLPMSNDAP